MHTQPHIQHSFQSQGGHQSVSHSLQDLRQASNKSPTFKHERGGPYQVKMASARFPVEEARSPLTKMELNEQNLKDVKSFLTKRRSSKPAMSSLPSGKHFTQQSRASLQGTNGLSAQASQPGQHASTQAPNS